MVVWIIGLLLLFVTGLIIGLLAGFNLSDWILSEILGKCPKETTEQLWEGLHAYAIDLNMTEEDLKRAIELAQSMELF